MAVDYEWDVEERDDEGDLIDHHHVGSYREALAMYAEVTTGQPVGAFCEIVLVRDDDRERTWAYVRNNVMATHFLDSAGVEYCKVPKQYINEVTKAHA